VVVTAARAKEGVAEVEGVARESVGTLVRASAPAHRKPEMARAEHGAIARLEPSRELAHALLSRAVERDAVDAAHDHEVHVISKRLLEREAFYNVAVDHHAFTSALDVASFDHLLKLRRVIIPHVVDERTSTSVPHGYLCKSTQ